MQPPVTGVVLLASLSAGRWLRLCRVATSGLRVGLEDLWALCMEGPQHDFRRVLSSSKLQDQPRLGVGEVTPCPPKGGVGESRDKEMCVRDGRGLL